MRDHQSVTINTFSRWEQLLFFLALCSIVLPAGAQSTISGMLLIWFISKRVWRDPVRNDARSWWQSYTSRFPSWKYLAIGLAGMAFLSLCAFFGQRIMGPADFAHLGKDLSKWIRLMGKQGIYGCLMIIAFTAAVARGFDFTRLLKPLACFLVIYVLYMLAQRYYGIDWVHGFSAKIADHRFAHGVFRPAGMMSHPLSLAFSSLNLALLTLGFSLHLPKPQRYWCAGIFSLLTCIIILSATRWALAVLGLSATVLLWPAIRRYWKWSVAVAILGMAVLLIEGSLIKRFIEPFVGVGPIELRFPRMVFWEVHWRLFSEWPLFGAGFPQHAEQLQEYYQRFGYAGMQEKYNAHNIYLQTAADLGLIGLSGFLIFIAAHIYAARKILPNPAKPIFAMLVLSGVLGGLMQNTFHDHEYVYAWWLCISILIAHSLQLTRQGLHSPSP